MEAGVREPAEPDRQVERGDAEPLALEDVDIIGSDVAKIPVHISYEIIRLFSEGLYQSPQKAVEELVSNSYDAGATSVHVLVPPPDDAEDGILPPLWVIDDGEGMDSAGFEQLWRVADSAKAGVTEGAARLPIGQFGIGKLAAYVLAWRLTHVSSVEGVIRLTSMNFRRLQGRHQYAGPEPIDLDLKEISQDEAQTLLGDVRRRDAAAWDRMFGSEPASHWTAAGLSDFKDLYTKLSVPRLAWVLRTGLPLRTDFSVFLDGARLVSSKAAGEAVLRFTGGGSKDPVAEALELETTDTGVNIPGIDGEVRVQAEIYKRKLTEGKSDQYGRSHGFFVKVRERIINLEDELFGLDALNHSAWSRFSMEVVADGLRDHLLSSREGVRDSDSVQLLRNYMHGVFNICRRAYEESLKEEGEGVDLHALLRGAPSAFVTGPLIDSVEAAMARESYYISQPSLPAEVNEAQWISDFEEATGASTFARIEIEKTGPQDRVVRFIPDSRTLIINSEHPYIDKMMAASKSKGPAKLFGSAEVLLDALLQDQGFDYGAILDFFRDRDRILRLLAGEEPSTAAEVLRMLRMAVTHELAQERAVGMAFRVLGFEYEKRGGNAPGTDGVLYARLGRDSSKLADYKVVYDSKQTSHPAVPHNKVDVASLLDFQDDEKATYACFVAVNYSGQDTRTSKVNKKVRASVDRERPLTLLRVEDLRRLVELHYKYGITLTQMRSLFDEAHHTYEVSRWIDNLERRLTEELPQVPVLKLLEGLESAKRDTLATPNVKAVRQVVPELKVYDPERLIAALQAVESIVGTRWIEVDRGGDVILHHTASQVVANLDRQLSDFFGEGVNPLTLPALS